MKIFINPRTGQVVVEDVEDQDDEPVGAIMHPCCRGDELAWWLRMPGRMVAEKRYGRK